MMDAPGVEIWSVDLALARPGLLALDADLALLAPADREKVAQIQDRGVTDERLAAKVAVRLLIEGLAGHQVRAVAFAYARGGKPALPGIGYHFSLSHSGQRALIAIAGGPVGIDIETVRAPAVDASRRARIEAAASLFPANLFATWRPLPAAAPEQHFMQSWTRLEAVAKADGRGIGWLLSHLGVMGVARRQAAQANDDLVGLLAELTAAYEVIDLDAGAAQCAAVAMVKGGMRPDGLRHLPAGAEALHRLLTTPRILARAAS